MDTDMTPPKVKVFIISSGRAKAVPNYPEHFTWVVKDEKDKADYEANGAKDVVIGGTLCVSRNVPLIYGQENDCITIQLSDDLGKIYLKTGVDQKDKRELSIHEAIDYMVEELVQSPYYLAGTSTTGNPFYSDWKVPRKRFAFIIGDFIAVKPTHLRFDEAMTLKEDYDYTLQHIKEYRGILRLEHLLPQFTHRTNDGGAVSYRTAEKEQENIAYLEKKWGKKIIRRRPAKPNEILLNFPRSK